MIESIKAIIDVATTIGEVAAKFIGRRQTDDNDDRKPGGTIIYEEIHYHGIEGIEDQSKKDQEVLAYYLDACYGDNDADACNDAGVMIGDGKGAYPDLERSAELYKRACELGSALGCRNYARRLRQGKGVPLNVSEAKYYYEEACYLGDEEACEELDYL